MGPLAVPGVRLADGAAALLSARLGCPVSSLLINRLRQLPTPAHTFAPLYLPLAAQAGLFPFVAGTSDLN